MTARMCRKGTHLWIDGQERCAPCRQERRRRHYAENPEERRQSREASRRWHAEHPEHAREQVRRWREAHPDEAKELSRRWSAEHPDYARGQGRRWRAEHPDEAREASRAWREMHPEEVRETNRNWRETNPDQIKASNRKRRALKKGAEGSHTAEEWVALCESYDHRCLCCGQREGCISSWNGRLVELTEDHVVALVNGGTDYIWNIQPLCGSCNSSKRDRHSTDYRTPTLTGPLGPPVARSSGR